MPFERKLLPSGAALHRMQELIKSAHQFGGPSAAPPIAESADLANHPKRSAARNQRGLSNFPRHLEKNGSIHPPLPKRLRYTCAGTATAAIISNAPLSARATRPMQGDSGSRAPDTAAKCREAAVRVLEGIARIQSPIGHASISAASCPQVRRARLSGNADIRSGKMCFSAPDESSGFRYRFCPGRCCLARGSRCLEAGPERDAIGPRRVNIGDVAAPEFAGIVNNEWHALVLRIGVQ